MTRPRLVVHGHFYQPSRVDPEIGRVPPDPSAAPARDWNARISADCYRPNAELGNLGRMSWDLGPTLAGWLHDEDPDAYAGFVAGDRGRNGMAQPYHHTILPLASGRDRRTEIAWGRRDFEVRFGRAATGMWLPETAVDGPTLEALADADVRHTILAPWQLAGDCDADRPFRVQLASGRSIVVMPYDAALSTAVSFDPEATRDADRFARRWVAPRLAGTERPDGGPLAVIATDGELYGHHRPYRDLFLARLLGDADLGFDIVTLDDVIATADATGMDRATIVERTSWSCHHGVARWQAACACVDDGHWKASQRAAMDELAEAIDAATERVAGRLPGDPDPWAARDAYVDVVIGTATPAAFGAAWLGPQATGHDRAVVDTLMSAQRWRLAMFASCGWFWDRPDRPEPIAVRRAARYAARLIDRLAGTNLVATLDPALSDDGAGIRRAS